MPEVPQDSLPNVLPQPEQAPREQANLTANDFGAQIGEAAEYAGKLAQREQVWANQAEVTKAANQLSDYTNQKVYDPKTGIAHQQLGADAPQAVNDTLTDHTAKISEIRNGLQNDNQKVMFDRMSAEHMRGLTRSLYGYEAGQQTTANKEQDAAFQSNTATDAVRLATNGAPRPPGPDPVQHRIDLVEASIRDAGARDHEPPAYIDMQVAKATGNIHSQIVDRLATDGNTAGAQDYFNTNKAAIGAIPGGEGTREVDRLTRTLKIADTRDQSIQQSHAMLMDPDTGKPRDAEQYEALAYGQYLKDGNSQVYDATVQRGHMLRAQYTDAERAKMTTAYDAGSAQLEASHGDLEKVDCGIRVQIDSDPKIKAAFELQAKNIANNKTMPRNGPEFTGIMDFIARSKADPDATLCDGGPKISGIQFERYQSTMTADEYAEVRRAYREILSQKPAQGSGLSDSATINRHLETALEDAGMNKPKLFDMDGNAIHNDKTAAYIDLRRTITQDIENHGGIKKLGEDKLHDLVVSHLADSVKTIQHSFGPFGWSSTSNPLGYTKPAEPPIPATKAAAQAQSVSVPPSKTPPGTGRVNDVNAMSPGDLQNTLRSLRQQGYDRPTPDQVLDRYNRDRRRLSTESDDVPGTGIMGGG